MRRGGKTELEIEHGKLLLSKGEAKIWGWESPAGQERVRRRVTWLIQTCKLRPGVRVLECGCGTGIFTRQLAQSGAEITAIDISPDLIAQAQEACSAPNITFVNGNLETPYVLKNNYFDAICGVSVLHHLDLVKALKALRTKLKVDARFAFSEPNLLNPINRFFLFVPNQEKRRARGVSPTEMAFKPNELKDLFFKAGYTLDSLEMRDFLHPSAPKVSIPLAKKLERFAETMPLLKFLSGSIWVSGKANPVRLHQ